MKKGFFLKGKIPITVAILSLGLVNMTHGIILTVLSDLNKTYPEVGDTWVQFLYTVTLLGMVVGMISAEFFARKFRLKAIFLTCMAVFVFSGLIPLFLESYMALLICRVFLGVSSGMVYPLSMTLIYDIFVSTKERDTIVGWNGCVASIGRIVTYSIAGLIITSNYRNVFFIHIIGLVPFLLVLFFIPGDTGSRHYSSESDRSETGKKQILGKTVITWIAVSFLYMLFELCFSSNMSVLMNSTSFGDSQLAAFTLSVMTAGYFSCNLFYGKIASVTRKSTVAIGAVISAVGLVGVAFAPNRILVFISAFVNGFGEGVAVQGCVSRVLSSADVSTRSRAISVNSAMGNLGMGISPFVVRGLSVIFTGSVRGRYVVCAIVLLLLGMVLLISQFSAHEMNGRNIQEEKDAASCNR